MLSVQRQVELVVALTTQCMLICTLALTRIKSFAAQTLSLALTRKSCARRYPLAHSAI